MEVDVGSPSSGGGGAVAGESSHAGFYPGPSSSSASQQPRPGSARKRRRSLTAFTTDTYDPASRFSVDQSDAYFLSRDLSDDEDGSAPAKRRNVTTATLHRQEHTFRALGHGHTHDSYDSTVEDYEYEAAAAASDNGVDSPMHSLSLVSPSTSTVGAFAELYTQPTASNEDEDLEMGVTDSQDKPSPPSHRQRNTSTHTAMIPRQLRPASSQQLANTPAKPSPLVRGRATLSDEASPSSSTASSPRPASMDVSSSGTSSPHPLRRSVTTEMVSDMRRMAHTTTPVRTMSQDDMINTPVRRMSRSERAVRTPSPRPQLRPVEPGDEEAGSGSGSAMRTLHHSPGINSAPSFPGGKQMLRYTMGYRQDCDLCRNKVAGHYGHVPHRSASTGQ